MQNIEKKREREKIIVSEMINLYCKKNHKVKNGLCDECKKLNDYAALRTEKCPFMETKTFCSKCKVHCYNSEMQEKIKKVMKFSGPRMIFYHPVLATSHLIETIKGKLKKEKS